MSVRKIVTSLHRICLNSLINFNEITASELARDSRWIWRTYEIFCQSNHNGRMYMIFGSLLFWAANIVRHFFNQVTYAIDIRPKKDTFLDMVYLALEGLDPTVSPGQWLVDIFPTREYLTLNLTFGLWPIFSKTCARMGSSIRSQGGYYEIQKNNPRCCRCSIQYCEGNKIQDH